MAYYPSYSLQLPVIAGQLAPGVCFKNEQQRLNAFASVSYVNFPAEFSIVLVSATQPTVEQQDAMWVKVDGFNNPIGQFIFSSQYSKWIWPHPIPQNDGRLMLFAGDLADIPFLDGGDAGAISATTGAFWELDNDWTDRIPIGAGTVPEGDIATEFAGAPTYPTTYPAVRGVYVIRRTARQFLSGT